jgi:hypothetical protein
MKPLIRVFALVAAISFAALIVWASLRGDFGAEGAALMAMPWGRVTLVDLYLGLALYAGLVFVVEDKAGTALFWALPVFVLGNVWALLWVFFRWKQIIGKLKNQE